MTSELAAGEAIYQEHCAQCHGPDLQGQPNWQVQNADGTVPAAPLNGEGRAWKLSDDLLFRSIKLGGTSIVPSNFPSNMPSFQEHLTDEQIWIVLRYIKNRWTPMARARQERMNTK
ncbi:cytochrome c [Magnetovibrio sp. PR-2]|uniref:c-type cytochrome n=1 Tax=Magnetovibrio sp. PR-2 TaxID=3120356 RepID=UPI002FCE1469